jgi:transposase
LEQANAEIARLKGQPKKPHFSSKKSSQSVSAFLREKPDSKKNWHKSVKKGTLPIDEHVTLAGENVCECGSHDFQTIRTKTKVVQGMIIRRNTIAYHAKTKQCNNCGKISNASFPTGTKGLSFDSTIQTLVSYMKFDGRFTHPLLHRFFTGFGIRISYGEITTIMQRNSEKLRPSLQHLRTTGIKLSRYLQSDATGSKRKHKGTGKIFNQHLHILGNSLLSIFKITRRYNAQVMNDLLGSNGRKKPFVSDDGSPNGECLKCNDKQVCWVHEIRHYKKLFPFFNSHQKLQKKILGQWRKFYHVAKSYGHDPTKKKRAEIEAMFAKITTQKTGYDLLDKQLSLTGKKKDRLLLFLTYPFLPIQNNQCEQDLREFVIIRKISGETKSDAGDRSIERHLSVIQTAKKQGLDVFQTLHGLLIGKLSPEILTAKSV